MCVCVCVCVCAYLVFSYTHVLHHTECCSCFRIDGLVHNSLIYITITRPDLSYPVGLLSQFMQTPRDIHLDCAKRVLQYMSGTMDYGILYKMAMPIRLEGYTDTVWAGYKVDRKSTS